MTKKKVTAPLTYNPGKGRPKEHLAYLNYQEMQALKRLNGNNQERGPRGLPSFPPADAKGSSSKASSTGARGPTGPSGQARSSPAGNKGGAPGSVSRTSTSTGARGPTGPAGQARSSPAGNKGGTPGSVSRSSGSVTGGGGKGGVGASSRTGSAVTGAKVGTSNIGASGGKGGASSVSRISGGTLGGNQRDAQFREAAASRSISKAVQTPALKQDAGRSAIGGISKDKSVGLADGSKIRGAIKGIQETAAEAALRRQGPIGPAPQQYKTIEDFNRAFAQELANKQFARTGYSPQELNRLAQGVYGEAAAEGYMGMNPAARSMVNSIAGGIEVPSYSYLGGSDFDKLADRYTVFQDPNKPFKSAGVGSLNQTQGLFSLAQAASPESAFSKAADISDRIKNATHYYAQETVKPSWADKSFERYGQHTFGTADAISEQKIAAAREKVFGDAERTAIPSVSAPIPRVRPENLTVVPTSATPKRTAVPGLIQYVGLDRPEAPPPSPPTAGRSAVVPTARPSKIITDRVLQEPSYRPYDIRVTSPPAPLMDVSFEAGLEGKIQDRILPQSEYAGYGDFTPPRTGGMSYTPKLPAVPPMRGATAIASRFPVAAVTPSPSSMRAAIDVASQLPAGVRTPEAPSLRSATDLASRIPPGVRTPSPPTIRSAIEGMPRAPSYSAIPSPTSMGVLPSSGLDAAKIGGFIGAGISAVRAAPETFQSVVDTIQNVGVQVGRFANAQSGILGLLGGGAIANKEVSEYAQNAIKSGAQKISALQETYNKAINDATKAQGVPSPNNKEVSDIERGLATVSLAEGYKLGEGKRPILNLPSPESRPYDVRLGEVEVAVPMRGANGEVVNGIATIDGYVKSVPGLDDAGKSALRRSMIGDASRGMLDFTTEDINRKVAEAKAESTPESPQYNRVATEEAISPFGPRSYDSPYPTDENGVPIQNVSESDLAKIRARRRGEEYAPTPQERNAIRAGKIVTNVITGRIPGLNKIINTEEKMKDFYSRPSWEQEYIAQRASDWAAIRGERPVTKAEAEEIKERTGRDVPRKPGGISGLGGGRDQTYEKIVSEIPDSSAPETPSEPSTPSGRRPDIYYMWDLGVNIPSPGDPNYTQYQTYLAERLAAQQAMGFV